MVEIERRIDVRRIKGKVVLSASGVIPPELILKVLKKAETSGEIDTTKIRLALIHGWDALANLMDRGGVVSSDGIVISTLTSPDSLWPILSVKHERITASLKTELGYSWKQRGDVMVPVFFEIRFGEKSLLARNVPNYFREAMNASYHREGVSYPRFSCTSATNQFLIQVARIHGKGELTA